MGPAVPSKNREIEESQYPGSHQKLLSERTFLIEPWPWELAQASIACGHTHVSVLIQVGIPFNAIFTRIGHSRLSATHEVFFHPLPGMGRDGEEGFGRGRT